MEKFVYLKYINQLRDRLLQKNGLIQVLIGPRQVGKTTSILRLLKTDFAKTSMYVSADGIFDTSGKWITEQWIEASESKKLLVIDEIQKCENWAETIKKLFDESKRNGIKVQCVLLGSSSLEIQKGLTESLTGRFQLTNAFHWNFSESNELTGMTFKEYLHYGGYPGSYVMRNNPDWFDYVKNSIVNTVIEKDILQFHTVKSPSLFRQAFEILIAYPAQEISFTKLLGQLQDRGNVELIKNYIRLFEGAFLMRALEKYSEKTIKTKSSSPKILPLAPCLYQLTLRDEYDSEENGRALELIVGAQLVRTKEEIYYWREGNNEVDFVLVKGKKLWAIEVKSGRKKSAKGLLSFKERFKKAILVLIDEKNYFEFEADPMLFLEKLK